MKKYINKKREKSYNSKKMKKVQIGKQKNGKDVKKKLKESRII